MTCRHCRIRFLAHPRNAGRRDLLCPFGCRQHCRRQCANARSRKHNGTVNGKRSKKLHNSKRSKCAHQAGGSPRDLDTLPSCVEPQPVEERLNDADSVNRSGAEVTREPVTQSAPGETPGGNTSRPEAAALPLEGLLLDESTLTSSRVLPYVLMVASLIERRAVLREELVVALRRRMRQRSMGLQARRDYVLRYLNQHPP